MKNYVVVLPDGTEHFVDRQDSWDDSMAAIAEDAVYKSGLTTPRRNPQTVKAQVFRLELKQGKIDRRSMGTYAITPPRTRMTQEEYDDEMSKAMLDLPPEFKAYVSRVAWDQGHSAGYEEVVSIAQEMASDLEDILNAYHARLAKR